MEPAGAEWAGGREGPGLRGDGLRGPHICVSARGCPPGAGPTALPSPAGGRRGESSGGRRRLESPLASRLGTFQRADSGLAGPWQ